MINCGNNIEENNEKAANNANNNKNITNTDENVNNENKKEVVKENG